MEEKSIAGEIDKVREAEEENYQTASRVLGDSLSLVDDLVNLYDLLAKPGGIRMGHSCRLL